MELIAFVLSSLGTVCICIPPLLKGKNMKRILLLVFLTNALLAASYILTGARNGAASCCIGATQTLINYFFFERKGKKIPAWLIAIYALAFTAANLLVFTRVTDAIAIVASLAFIMAICQKSGRTYRLWTLGNTSLWILYDLSSLSFGPLSTHLIQFTCIILGIVTHDRKKTR